MRKTVHVLMVMAIVGSVLAGCAPTAAPTPAPEEVKVIKIGAPNPLTGPWAEVGNNSLHGAQLAVEQINARGGIESMGGARLELVPGDTQNDPAIAASVTRRLIDQDKVTALVGCYLSSYTLTASTEAEKAGIPMLSQSFVDELTARGYKYYFQLPPKSSHFGGAAVSYIKLLLDDVGLQFTKAAIVSSNDAASKGQAEAARDLAAEYGFEVVYYELFASGLTDAMPIATNVRDNGAEIMFATASTPDWILIVRTLRSIGWNRGIVGIGGGGVLTAGFGEALGDAVDGVFATAAWNGDLPYDEVATVNAEFADRWNEPFMPQESGELYTAVWIIKEALEAVGEADPAKLRDYISTTVFDTGRSAMMPGSPVDFDDTGWNQNSFPVMIEWKDGIPRTVWPKEVQTITPFFE